MALAKITQVSGRGVYVPGSDIDTDRIIPARYLRCVTFDGLGAYAFEDDRAQLKAQGKLHSFDDARFAGAKVLVANANFGCGSSREHAPQAIARWGVQAIIAVSYSEIFHGNCVAMGLPAVRVSQADSETLQSIIEADPKAEVILDIEALKVSVAGKSFACQLGDGPRKQFLNGSWDALGELVEGLPQVKAKAAKLPYLNAFG
jgi:3-isopropylmalate/(R)-2-methylmalate dehydratase small subunit